MLHVDQWLVAVSKPSGELVHPGWARGEPTTMSRVRDALGQHVFAAHRLDRGTSGVVLFARDKASARALQATWPTVQKHYLALVRGTPPASGTIDHPVKKGEDGPDRVAAVTHFTLLATSPHARCSLVAAIPETGRLHQIRRHFKHISHPLIGDVRYGKGAINRSYRSDYDLHRLALHAAQIDFVHPITGEHLCISAPLPDDLARAFTALDVISQTGRASSAPTPPPP